MKRLKDLWDRAEKIAIYVVLFALIILELIAYFVPQVATAMDTRGGLLLLAMVLLFFFRYIDERIGDRRAVVLEPEERFTQGLFELVENRAKVESMNIFAHTGLKYFYALLESGIRIERLRVLLRDFGRPDTIQFPSGELAKKALRQEVSTVTESLIQLKLEGKIQSLDIRLYPFDPTCHFCIVDNKRLYFGLFQPQHPTSGVHLLNSFIVKDTTPQGKRFLDDFRIFFETTLQDFGRPLEPQHGS